MKNNKWKAKEKFTSVRNPKSVEEKKLPQAKFRNTKKIKVVFKFKQIQEGASLLPIKSNQIQVQVWKFQFKSPDPSIKQANFSTSQVFNKSWSPTFKPLQTLRSLIIWFCNSTATRRLTSRCIFLRYNL